MGQIERDFINPNIGPQLSFGRIFSPAYQSASFGPQLPSKKSEKASDDGENSRNSYTRDGQTQVEPFIGRLLVSIFGIGCCFVGSFFCGYFAFDGSGHLTADIKRRVLAAALIVVGDLIGFGGQLLFVMDAFRRTWGWLL